MSKYRIKILGKTYEIEVEKIDQSADSPSTETKASDVVKTVPNKNNNSKPEIPFANTGKTQDGCVCSPMPGTVIKINYKEGDLVEKGKTVLVLEAMKMENELTAPRNGILSSLYVAEKQAVQGGDALFRISGETGKEK